MTLKKALIIVGILILLFLAAPAIHIKATDAGGMPSSTSAAPTTVLPPETTTTTTIDLSFLNTTTTTSTTVPKHYQNDTPNTTISSNQNDSADRWDLLAQCESGGNWSYPPVAGGFSGGIMFHIGTWRAMGGTEYAEDAYLATREQQITIAERVLATSGWRAWPGCSKRFGWI